MLLILVLAMSEPKLLAQSQGSGNSSSFDAISVKESSGGRIPLQWLGPRLVGDGLPLQTLLAVAYEVPLYQLADLPAWVRSVRWEINALASRTPTQAEQVLFLRALLAERFGTVARTETAERLVYVLVRSRADGQTGAGLRQASFDCAALMSARAAAAGPAAPPPAECNVRMGPGMYARRGVPLASLTDFLRGRLERPVIDRTGLTGLFDIELTFRPFSSGGDEPVASDEPDLLTALVEQLALRAESTQAPVELTVFKRIERPTAN